MSVMSLDNTLWLVGVLTEAGVLGLLLYRRVWQTLPVFVVYCVWDFIANLFGLLSHILFPSIYNPATYLGQTVIDSALQFGVFVELAWSVLRPIRSALPRFTIVVVAGLILGIGAAIWPFAALPGLAQSNPLVRLIGHMQQTVSILRIGFFLLLAGCSQLLSIGWRDRELQVATGMGFYSLVSLAAAVLSTHEASETQYLHLNQFVIGSFLCSLVYWLVCFAQKEAQRREFTPQMENLLLAVAGIARAERTALAEAKKQNHQ
jgi:hypothetical protein